MLCEKCKKNEACYHSTIIINGQSESTHLCNECAKKEKLIDNDTNFFKNFFNDFNDIFNSKLDDFFCPSCSLGFNQFRSRGFLGCPDCFDVFKHDLESIVNTSPNKEEITFNTPTKSKEEKQLADLKEKLDKAIKDERYEDASDYNKKIKEIIKKLSKNN